MKVSYNWLQTYFDTTLPSPEEVGEKLTFHAFEIEGIEKVGGDSVIDVDVLPNRAHDCLSHRGIAKELSVILEIPLKEDVFRVEENELPRSKRLTLTVEDEILCKRHTAVLITGVTVGESPEWLRARLESMGQRSINNIVDATNYVMFNIGQPIHAFDADRFKEEDDTIGIAIRQARKGEEITLLGESEVRTLDKETLVLADIHNDTPLDVAGIKGGVAAELDEYTTSIVVSAANFNQTNIRKTSQKLKLRTDASTRFENGLAPDITYHGLTQVVKLIQELAGGNVEGYVDEYPQRKSITYKIGVSIEDVNKLLGTDITGADIEHILSRFGFTYEKVNPIKKVLELAPTLKGASYKYSASISYDAPHIFDCSSFIGYVFSQAGIALPRMVIDQYVYGEEINEDDLQPGDLVFSRSNPETRKEYKFKFLANGETLTHFGPQTESQEFLSGTKVDGGVSHNGIYLGDGRVIHASESMGVTTEKIKESGYFNDVVGYRRMVSVADNERYVVEIPFERLDLHAHTSFLTSGNKEDLIEEIGRIYGYENIGEDIPKKDSEVPIHRKYYYAEKVREFLTSQGFTEVYTYSLRDRGELEIENPLASDKNFVRSTLREGIKESVVLNEKNVPVLGLDIIKVFEIGNVYVSGEECTMVCLGINKNNVGDILNLLEDDLQIKIKEGVGHTEVLASEKDTKEFHIIEFNLDVVLTSLPEPKEYDVRPEEKTFSYKPFSLYPAVLRDIAVWVPDNLSGDDVLTLITKEAGELLIQSSLFDEYRKDGRVSYAFKLVFQSQEKTLSDEEVNEIMEKIANNLNARDGFEVR